MSLCWEYTCKKCGKNFDTAHPDSTGMCMSCWSALTERQRQSILPGATPLKDNQPQSVSGGSDAPRTKALADAMIAANSSEKVMVVKLAMLCVDLERENQQLESRCRHLEANVSPVDYKRAYEMSRVEITEIMEQAPELLQRLFKERDALQLRAEQAEAETRSIKLACADGMLELQSKLTQSEQELMLVINVRKELEAKIAQLEQQNAALREALIRARQVISCGIFGIPEEAVNEETTKITKALSLPPTTQDWVKKEDVRPIVEKFKEAVSIVEDTLDYRPDDEAAGQWAEVKQGLKLAKQLGLDKE